MDSVTCKQFLAQWMEENKQQFHDLSDYLWEHPELGLEEFSAHEAITNLLKRHGFQVESGIGGMPTAFVATYGEGKPVIGINVEYDCLPGLSQKKDVPYQSPVIEGAPGQGCGHNLLGTAGVAGGIALRYLLEREGLKATIRLFGSPYEEASVGKPLAGRAGVYQGVDCFLDWHPWYTNHACYEICNSVFVVAFTFTGKGAHGSMPWLGRSALDSALLFAHALEILREHLPPDGPNKGPTINYTFTDVGAKFANVVPETTTVQLYGRAKTVEISQDMYQRIMDAAEGCAKATGTRVEPHLITYTHNKLPNVTLSKVVYDNLVQVGAPEFTQEEQAFAREIQRNAQLEEVGLDQTIQPFGPNDGPITDTSEFSWNAPYAAFNLTTAPKSGWHNWMVTACAGGSIGHKAIDKAAQIFAGSAVDLILHPELLEKAREEWQTCMDGREYHSLLPHDHQVPLGINRSIMDQYFPGRKKSV